MRRNVFLFGLLAVTALVQVSPAPLRALVLENEALQAALVPTGAAAIPASLSADLNGDGRAEVLALAAGRVTIFSGKEAVWQSPASWHVVQTAMTDLDGDGRPEAALLVWRPFQPWPVDRWLPHGGRIQDFHDADGQSCHLILIGARRDSTLGELWAGSALAEPIRAFAAADLNGDGRQELVTLDGRYSDPRSAPARDLKVWDWNGFGFTVVSTLQGTFSQMALVRSANGQPFILIP